MRTRLRTASQRKGDAKVGRNLYTFWGIIPENYPNIFYRARLNSSSADDFSNTFDRKIVFDSESRVDGKDGLLRLCQFSNESFLNTFVAFLQQF